MYASQDVAGFKNMGSASPKHHPRQQFCGMFCPVEGSTTDNKTLDFGSLSGRGDGGVIDQQKDISQPRRVEIRESTGKEALQNLNDKIFKGESGQAIMHHCQRLSKERS